MESFKKSFKSHGSYKKSFSSVSSHEELPILFDHRDSSGEVMIKIDGSDSSSSIIRRDDIDDKALEEEEEEEENNNNFNNNKIKNNKNNARIKEEGSGSFDFMQQQQQRREDPPLKLIGQFLDKQRTNTGGEIALDMDLEMEELRRNNNNNNNINRSSFLSPWSQSRELRVSFDPSSVEKSVSSESVRRRINISNSNRQQDSSEDQSSSTSSLPPDIDDDDDDDDEEEEVVRCTSNATFTRNHSNLSIPRSGLLTKIKTRSRLQDPPPDEIIELKSDRVPKSGPIRSGLLSKVIGGAAAGGGGVGSCGGGIDEDDDSLLFDDLPEEYMTNNLSLLTLVQWISLIVIITALVCSLAIHDLKKKSLWQLKLWKWEVMILVLICGRLVSGWGIRLIVFFIERNFLLRKRVLYFVYGLRRPVQNCLWLALVLIAWGILFDKKVEREAQSHYLKYITKILICLLIGTLLWLVKTLMVKVMASSFHVSTYFDRIQESLFYQYVIETLSGPPLIEIKRNDVEMEKTAAEIFKLQNAGAVLPPDLREAAFAGGANKTSGRMIGKSMRQLKSIKLSGAMSSKKVDKGVVDNGISIDHLHKLNHKNVSAWNMKRLVNMVRHGSLSTLDEQILHGAAHVNNEDDSAKQIRSEYEAKAAARKIFLNVARRGSKYIYFDDLLRFMEEDEALKTMSLFEGAAEHKRISKSSLKNWVVNAFRERRALALTLNDTKTAVTKLHKIVNVIVAIIIIVISLQVLEITSSKFLLFASSQLFLVAFVFGNTCKTIFEDIIFLFIIHPFDVGDRCEVDGVQMVVEEMNVLTTVFLRYDNMKIIFPNSVLSQKPIHNYYRSPEMGDAVEFCVHIATPPEKIALIRQRITCYIENKKEHWYPNPIVILKDVEDLNKLRIAVWLSHKMNYHDILERWVRRALFVEEMVKYFRELDMQFRLLPIDINVCSMPSMVNSDRMPSTWNTTTAGE
ncbi:hypothetical protein Dsin_024449 [Dipteronia sinensis]|uniref:Mechanosensitive ion channel protein n=1 Tax=Dipteronia sinensis TaxID=43782 RepID=A0AAD9ZV47_9ROSI|nr:hypothetical protein Dsin_024449 [Dipteronia sinensis]